MNDFGMAVAGLLGQKDRPGLCMFKMLVRRNGRQNSEVRFLFGLQELDKEWHASCWLSGAETLNKSPHAGGTYEKY